MNQVRKRLLRLLAAALCLSCLSQSVCLASETEQQNTGDSSGYPEEFDPTYEDDPDYLKRFGLMDTGLEEDERAPVRGRASGDPYTGLTYTHSEQQEGKEIIHGIDVSKWQGTVDWDAVKADGVEYVFIRCGYTNTGEIFYTNEDERFAENIEGAYRAGLKVGIYYFSQSITVSEAQKEAEKTCKLLEAYRDMITMPVVYDFEKEAKIQYRANKVTKEQGTQNALAFCSVIADNGYDAYYYGSSSELPKYYDLDALSGYGCWIARYGQKTTYEGDYAFWQYSNAGRVDGIGGKVDCNFWYVEGGQPEEPDAGGPGQVTGLKRISGGSTSVKLSWNPVSGADRYEVCYSQVKGGPYTVLDTVTKTSYQATGLTPSTGYSFVVRACNDSGKGAYSKACGTATTKEEQITVYTTANVNLRQEASAASAILATVPKGTVLDIRFRVKDGAGNTWYKLTYTVGGEKYTGYLHGKYVGVGTRAKPTQPIYLRSGPGKGYQSKTTVKSNNKLILLDTEQDSDGGKWYQVYTQKGNKGYLGYCMAKYVRPY